MKKHISVLFITLITLVSCGTESQKEDPTDIPEKTEIDSAIGACDKASKLVQKDLLSKNTNPEVKLEFLSTTYAQATSKCYLSVVIDNKGEKMYNLFDVESARSVRSYDSLEKLEIELRTYEIEGE